MREKLLELPRLNLGTLHTGPWRGVLGGSASETPWPYIRCGIRIDHAPTDYEQRDSTCWELLVARRRITRSNNRQQVLPSFTASIRFYPNGLGTRPNVVNGLDAVTRGQSQTWPLAIEMVSWAERAIREAIYKPTTRAVTWMSFRPFKVLYPWRLSEEPNAKYSPFKFVGDVFDERYEGAVASTLDDDLSSAAKLTTDCGGDAFLWGPVNGGEYRLYHRDHMTHYDVIDLQSWYARIIAGSD